MIKATDSIPTWFSGYGMIHNLVIEGDRLFFEGYHLFRQRTKPFCYFSWRVMQISNDSIVELEKFARRIKREARLEDFQFEDGRGKFDISIDSGVEKSLTFDLGLYQIGDMDVHLKEMRQLVKSRPRKSFFRPPDYSSAL